MNLLEALQAKSQTLPNDAGWPSCLQEVYTTFRPGVQDFAQAIYTAWTVQPPPSRVTFAQMTAGLGGVTTVTGAPAYGVNDIGPVVAGFYMEVAIYVDTVALRAGVANGTYDGTQPTNPLIAVSDNHPEDDHIYFGEVCELDDEGLTGNMTIHWRAASNSTPGDTVTMTAFVPRSAGWADLASQPVALPDGSWVAYANALPTPNTTVAYSFNYTINGCPLTFWFDPEIGDHGPNKTPAVAAA